MTNEELHWLAGWLEGEGTFYFTRSKSPKIIIQAFSTDKDVIEKAAAIVGAKIYFIKPRMEKSWNRLDGWRFSLECKPAESLMRAILPLMGNRRSEQIRKALDVWENRSNRPIEKLCACGCGRTVFGGPRLIYARRGGACAQRAYRLRSRAA